MQYFVTGGAGFIGSNYVRGLLSGSWGTDASKVTVFDAFTYAGNIHNLDECVNCFTGSTKSKIRKQVAIRFVQHDVAMELLDTQVITAGKTTGEVAVKYRLVLSGDRFDVVSLVAVKQENGYWRISSEEIQSYEHQSPSMCSPSRYACLGGTCRVAAR